MFSTLLTACKQLAGPLKCLCLWTTVTAAACLIVRHCSVTLSFGWLMLMLMLMLMQVP
jgi:hypothetical protein